LVFLTNCESIELIVPSFFDNYQASFTPAEGDQAAFSSAPSLNSLESNFGITFRSQHFQNLGSKSPFDVSGL